MRLYDECIEQYIKQRNELADPTKAFIVIVSSAMVKQYDGKIRTLGNNML